MLRCWDIQLAGCLSHLFLFHLFTSNGQSELRPIKQVRCNGPPQRKCPVVSLSLSLRYMDAGVEVRCGQARDNNCQRMKWTFRYCFQQLFRRKVTGFKLHGCELVVLWRFLVSHELVDRQICRSVECCMINKRRNK